MTRTSRSSRTCSPRPPIPANEAPSRVFQAHLINHRIDFSWEDTHDGERGHVETDAGACFELCGGEGGAVGDYVSGAGRGFDDDCMYTMTLSDVRKVSVVG